MKKIMLGAVALVALGTAPALAADLPIKAPPVVAPVYNWTGFYVGGSVGGGWGTYGVVDPRAVGTQNGAFVDGTAENNAQLAGLGPLNTNPSGALGGVQGGYNWQFNRFVLGVEADYSWANINGSQSRVVNAAAVGFAPFGVQTTMTASENLSGFGTVRGRAGFVVFDSDLFYATGGFAYGRASSAISVAQIETGAGASDMYTPSAASAAKTLTGWTVGAGNEWSFGGNWSVKAEYLYYDLGHLNYTSPTITGLGGGGATTPFTSTTLSPSASFRGSIVRVGVNYRWGGPVVAKY